MLTDEITFGCGDNLMNPTLYDKLVQLAKDKDLDAYSRVAPLINLSMDKEEDRDEISRLLGEIAVFEHGEGRPMLTALVVHKGDDNNPGEGFFDIAKSLGIYDGSRDPINRLKFWVNQVTDVYNYWEI